MQDLNDMVTQVAAHTRRNSMTARLAPPWSTTDWFNTKEPLSLESLRGQVVVLEAFQMLCPGCVAHGLPQAQRVAHLFADKPVAVIGLHTVFEHHQAMGPVALRAFLYEYRIDFPVGIDAPDAQGGTTPQTMQAYGMRGTPTLILIDAKGQLRQQVFGTYDDLLLGAEIATLLAERSEKA